MSFRKQNESKKVKKCKKKKKRKGREQLNIKGSRRTK